MDDLNEKIARLLSDPSSMAKIQSAMAALGGESTPTSEPTVPATAQKPPAQTEETTGKTPSFSLDGLPDLSMLQKLAPLMGAFNQDNDDTRLLQALRPYLHGEREQRLDDTMKMLRLTRLLPLLQEQGIFGKTTERG